jgi:hypothetical protein
VNRTLITTVLVTVERNIVSVFGTVLERIGERTRVRERWEVKFPRFQKTFGFKGRIESGKEVSLCCVFHGWYYSDTTEDGNRVLPKYNMEQWSVLDRRYAV